MAKRIEWGSDEDFIQKYMELKSSRKMGELYNCDKTSVLNHAKKIGFNPNEIQRDYKLSLEDKQKIINFYNEKTSTELAKIFNVSRGMITKIWYDANLTGKQINSKTPTIDLTNQVFGELTVLYKTEKRNSNGSVYWHCKCSCGKEKDILGQSLKQGITISCGHIGKEKLKLGRGLNFQDLSNQRFGKLIVLKRIEDKIYNNEKKVQWKCKCDCGNCCNVISDNLKSGNTQSCGLCNETSHGNLKIEQLLKENNISYIREKRFIDCKDKKSLPFDFYVNDMYCIEYDGIQHFEENTIFDYQTTHYHDIIKSKYCKENNIPLIRIPYTHYKNLCIEDLLLETSHFIEK